MMKIPMSRAASTLLRVLTARGGVERNRILLTDAHSTDWQSLTFNGERHHLVLRVIGTDSSLVVDRMCLGLDDAEFSIPNLLVADIGVVGSPRRMPGGAIELIIETLTITAD